VAEEQATTETLPETVSREAHQRMTDERNTLKAERDQLATTITDLTTVEKARAHFKEKGVDDPEWAADIALPSIKSMGDEMTDLSAYLDDKFSRLYPTGDTGDGAPADDGIPTPDAVEPPGFARPSPSAEGAPPGQKKYKVSDPEIQQLIQANDKPAIEKLDAAGQIEWLTATPLVPG